MKFTAKDVELSIDQIANAFFADPETNSGEPAVFLVSRDLSIPNSAYYFEINDQSFSSYGGLKSVHLSRNKLVVQLEPGLVKKFDEDDFAEIDISLKVDNKTYAKIKDILEKIFAPGEILTVE